MSSPTDTIRQRFETKIARPLALPVLFNNAPNYWLNGKRVPKLLPHHTHFIKYNFKVGATKQATFGNVMLQDDRTPGVIIIQINGPVGAGTEQLDEYAETIKSAFRRITVGCVTYKTPSKGNPRRRGKWWALAVKCPVIINEFTAPSEA